MRRFLRWFVSLLRRLHAATHPALPPRSTPATPPGRPRPAAPRPTRPSCPPAANGPDPELEAVFARAHAELARLASPKCARCSDRGFLAVDNLPRCPECNPGGRRVIPLTSQVRWRGGGPPPPPRVIIVERVRSLPPDAVRIPDEQISPELRDLMAELERIDAEQGGR